MKKISAIRLFLCLLLSTLLVFSLPACDNGKGSDSTGGSQVTFSILPDKDSQSAAVAEKILVAYFSATGSTRAVAETVASHTGGVLFEIVPADAYTSDDLNYNSASSRVYLEHSDDERQVELAEETPDNWSDYDVVFIGYPIWWGGAAFPVETFVRVNDFTGKTVIPFCTSSSSGLGSSAANLEKIADSGDWQTGTRFRSSVSAEDVTAWVDGLKFGKDG